MALTTQEEWMVYAHKEGCRVARNEPFPNDIEKLADIRFWGNMHARIAFIAGYYGELKRMKEAK